MTSLGITTKFRITFIMKGQRRDLGREVGDTSKLLACKVCQLSDLSTQALLQWMINGPLVLSASVLGIHLWEGVEMSFA